MRGDWETLREFKHTVVPISTLSSLIIASQRRIYTCKRNPDGNSVTHELPIAMFAGTVEAAGSFENKSASSRYHSYTQVIIAERRI